MSVRTVKIGKLQRIARIASRMKPSHRSPSYERRLAKRREIRIARRSQVLEGRS